LALAFTPTAIDDIMRDMPNDPFFPDYLQSILDQRNKWEQEIERIRTPESGFDKALRDMLDIAHGQDDVFRNTYGSPAPYAFLEPSRTTTVNSRATELEAEVAQLKKDIRQKIEALRTKEADSETKDREIATLKEEFHALQTKEQLAYLLNRVSSAAHSKLILDDQFRQRFRTGEPCNVYVMSIDIRRSTELMLKARDPRLFAEFMITLAGGLRHLVLQNYGVFDKFTGDGVLAFFPDFYSGDDAGYRVLSASAQCHARFFEHYQRNRAAFTSVLLDTGLGIGIDYGKTQIVEIGGEFTVVGAPVVYACRMSSAEAGQTYVNQPAFDQLFQRYAAFDFAETELMIKHEGRTLAYSVRPNGKEFTPSLPEWEVEQPPPVKG